MVSNCQLYPLDTELTGTTPCPLHPPSPRTGAPVTLAAVGPDKVTPLPAFPSHVRCPNVVLMTSSRSSVNARVFIEQEGQGVGAHTFFLTCVHSTPKWREGEFCCKRGGGIHRVQRCYARMTDTGGRSHPSNCIIAQHELSSLLLQDRLSEDLSELRLWPLATTRPLLLARRGGRKYGPPRPKESLALCSGTGAGGSSASLTGEGGRATAVVPFPRLCTLRLTSGAFSSRSRGC